MEREKEKEEEREADPESEKVKFNGQYDVKSSSPSSPSSLARSWVCVVCGAANFLSKNPEECMSCHSVTSEESRRAPLFQLLITHPPLSSEIYGLSSCLIHGHCVMSFADGSLSMMTPDLKVGKVLISAPATGKATRIYSVCEIPTTSYVATFSENGIISVWDLDIESLSLFLDTSQRQMVRAA